MQEQKKIEDLSIIELKSEVYDRIAQRERIDMEMKTLNQEIARRASQGVNTPPKAILEVKEDK